MKVPNISGTTSRNIPSLTLLATAHTFVMNCQLAIHYIRPVHMCSNKSNDESTFTFIINVN